MRRLPLSLVATCGLAALTACGGSGINAGSSTPTAIVFTNGSSQVNDFFVALNGSAPVLVAATAVKGSGATSTIIPDVQFTWQAAYAPAGTTYATGASPNGQGTCGSPAAPSAINSLLQQLGNGNPFPFYSGYTQLAEQPNSNPPNYTQQAQEIFVGPPAIIVGPDPSLGATATVVQPATGSTNYCLTVIATAVASGVKGTVTVVVTP